MKKKILLGNEAIVEGALEAGVDFVSAYPGTPSSEIGNVFSKIASKNGVYFEFSTNEKIALEAAIGASLSGLKCLVAMKNFGVNVCLDSLLPFAYTGTKGPTVIIVADDPSCWSSGQSEENSRGFAELSHLPILEPSDPAEAKEFTKFAFEISEKFKLPVIVRITTRVAHQRMPVELISRKKKTFKKGKFVKNVKQFVTMPPRLLEMKEELLLKLEGIKELAEKSGTEVYFPDKKGKNGAIVSGVSYLHLMEAVEKTGIKLPILKIDFFNPLPEKKIKEFIKGFEKVLVVEELEPFIENKVKIIAKDINPNLKVFGKNVLPVTGELNSEKIAFAVSKLFGKNYKINEKKIDLPKRFPRLCEGCPYWLIFSTIKKAAPKDVIYGGDIGCYMLSGFSPHNMQDYLFCMGSSIGIGHGIKKATNQKLISFIGDSTFFHSGIPGLINAVFNKSNSLIVVMDNRITAMTGHQTNPGVGKTGMGEQTEDIKIEEIAKACGVKNIKVIDPINIKDLEKTIQDFLQKEEVSVIVARRVCALLARRQKNG